MIKIYQAKMFLEEWNLLLDELSKQTTKMRTMEIVGVEENLLIQELEEAKVLRVSREKETFCDQLATFEHFHIF